MENALLCLVDKVDILPFCHFKGLRVIPFGGLVGVLLLVLLLGVFGSDIGSIGPHLGNIHVSTSPPLFGFQYGGADVATFPPHLPSREDNPLVFCQTAAKDVLHFQPTDLSVYCESLGWDSMLEQLNLVLFAS